MAEISYKFTRVEPIIEQATNKVLSFTIGVTADDGNNHSEYMDGIKALSPEEQKSIGDFADGEIHNLAISYAAEQGFYRMLKASVEAKTKTPIRGSNIVI